MLKKIFFVSFFTLSQLSYGEICPSISNIQNDNFQGWHALNIDSASPATIEELKIFKTALNHFHLAEWMKDAPEGESHCYYQDVSNNELNIYFAKSALTPTTSFWKKITDDIYQCNNQLENCVFKHSY